MSWQLSTNEASVADAWVHQILWDCLVLTEETWVSYFSVADAPRGIRQREISGISFLYSLVKEKPFRYSSCLRLYARGSMQHEYRYRLLLSVSILVVVVGCFCESVSARFIPCDMYACNMCLKFPPSSLLRNPVSSVERLNVSCIFSCCPVIVCIFFCWRMRSRRSFDWHVLYLFQRTLEKMFLYMIHEKERTAGSFLYFHSLSGYLWGIVSRYRHLFMRVCMSSGDFFSPSRTWNSHTDVYHTVIENRSPNLVWRTR